MRNKKGIAYLLLVAMVFAVFMFTGCSGGEEKPDTDKPAGQATDLNPSGEKLTIGWSERALAGTPWFEAMVGAAKELAAANNIELIVIDAQNKPEKQVADIEDLIARGVDGIVLDPCHPTAILTAVEQVNAAEIPIVGVNSAIDTSVNPNARIKTIITADNYTIGYGVGYELGKQWNKPDVNIVIMSGHIGDLEGWQRRSGFLAGFAEYQYEKFGASDINILAQRYAGDWDPDKAMTQMQDILVKFPKQIDVMFSEGDAMALSCITAMKSAGESDVLVGSIDGQLEAIEALRDGDIVAIGINSAVKTGESGIEYLMKVINGEEVSTRVYLPSPTITQENVKEYYKPGVPFL